MSRGRPLKVVRGPSHEERDTAASLLSQTDLAVSIIRDRIIDLTLEPGAKLDERLLMERFKLGRTPAREALNRLSSEGFVQIRRNKGAFVASIDLNQIRQFFEAYFAAERMAGYYCKTGSIDLVVDLQQIQSEHASATEAGNYLRITAANTAFHTRIAAACENEYIFTFNAGLHLQARRLSHVIYSIENAQAAEPDDYRKKIEQQHLGIIAAIRDGDSQELIDLLTRHAQLFHDRIVRAISDVRVPNFDFVKPRNAD